SSSVLSQIVAERSALLPVEGLVTNTNYKLGQNGLVGIKTGNTDEAGGCFLLATNRQIGGKTVTIVSAVLGAPSLYMAMNDSVNLANSTVNGFGHRNAITAGQEIGHYTTYDKQNITVTAQKDIQVF